MTSAVVQPPLSRPAQRGRWFRNKRYDLLLTLGVFGFAVLLGTIGCISTASFLWVLLADVWLLAYPHLTAMYSRVAFDRKSRKKHWFLITGLPPLVFIGTLGAAELGGTIALFTLYYFSQTWHYSRQSYGLARALGAASSSTEAPLFVRGRDGLTTALVYAFPVWGLLNRAHQNPSTFYNLAIVFPPVSDTMASLAEVVAVGLLVVWCYRHFALYRAGRSRGSATHLLFVLSHVVITWLSYVFIADITLGWLFINIWHNTQYIVFVWAANARRFEGGVDPEARLLSKLSQPPNVGYYLIVCAGLGAIFYLLLGWTTHALAPHLASVVLVAHLAVNFHHYLVDAVIWRRRKWRLSPPSRQR